MPKKILVYWRDIPSAVIYKKGRNKGKAQLSHRFQEAIDRAAMRAGKGGSDAYIAEWRRDISRTDETGSLDALAQERADELEAQFTDEQLAALIRNHGLLQPRSDAATTSD